MTPSKPLKTRIGVVGAGRWGRNFIRTFRHLPEVELAAVCDLNCPPEALLGSARYHDSLGSLLSAGGLDALVIATPAELHAPQAIAALEAGHHVLVEKPMALSLRDALQMQEAARLARRVLMVGHLMRYHPALLRLRQLLSSGHLGSIQHVECIRLSAGTPEAAASPWWSLAPHDISLLRYVTQEDITELVVRRHAAEQLVFARAKTPSFTANLTVGVTPGAKARRIFVHGSLRTARFDDLMGTQALAIHDGPVRQSLGIDALGPAAEPPDVRWQTVPIPAIEPLLAEVAHFVAAATAGERVATDADEGCYVVAALEAGARSLMTGARVRVHDVTSTSRSATP